MGHDHAHDPHDAEHGADGHHDEHAHDFDPEPVRELGDDEPRTPSWVPLLGAGIFLVLGTWFLIGSSSSTEAQAEPAAAPAPRPTPAAAADAAVRPQRRAPAVGGVPEGAPAEGAAAERAPSRPPQSPEERKALIERLKQQGAFKGRPPPSRPDAHGPGDGHDHPH